jgi:hypothetical protein
MLDPTKHTLISEVTTYVLNQPELRGVKLPDFTEFLDRVTSHFLPKEMSATAPPNDSFEFGRQVGKYIATHHFSR